MPRFVILEHDHPDLHWDLMLEVGVALKTWRLPAPLPDDPREALAIGDHRLAYLDYEGPVSGKRGTVKRWDAGTFEALSVSPTNWTIRLHGARWRGTIALRQEREPLWDVQCVPLSDADSA